MKVSYKPLCDILNEKNMKKKDLIKLASISENCMAKLGRNEYISMLNLARICKGVRLYT